MDGYTFTPLKESVSNNIANLASESLLTLAAACNADAACVGFTSNGSIKSALTPIADWVQWTYNPCQGLYNKDPGNILLVRNTSLLPHTFQPLAKNIVSAREYILADVMFDYLEE